MLIIILILKDGNRAAEGTLGCLHGWVVAKGQVFSLAELLSGS